MSLAAAFLHFLIIRCPIISLSFHSILHWMAPNLCGTLSRHLSVFYIVYFFLNSDLVFRLSCYIILTSPYKVSRFFIVFEFFQTFHKSLGFLIQTVNSLSATILCLGFVSMFSFFPILESLLLAIVSVTHGCVWI